MPTKTDEYLEAVVKAAFARELDVDENIARTLPFFAASLALAATLYSFILARMVPFAWTPLSLGFHALLAIGGGLLLWILWQLFQTVRRREYRIPPKETEIIAWADDSIAFHTARGLKPATVDARVAEDLRRWLIDEFAEAAEHNRAANRPKLAARANGFTALVALLVIAFFMIGIIFIEQRVSPDPKDQDHVADRTPVAEGSLDPAAHPARPAAAEAEAAGAALGREVPLGADGEHRWQVTGGAGATATSAPPALAKKSASPPPGR
jgi:hypothetical protein